MGKAKKRERKREWRKGGKEWKRVLCGEKEGRVS